MRHHCRVGIAFTVVLLAVVSSVCAQELTPDLKYTGGSKVPAEEVSLWATKTAAWARSLERLGFMQADVVAVGVIDSVDLRVVTTSKGDTWVETIEMTVDHCVKGACPVRTSFMGSTPFMHPCVRYSAGERVLLRLFWGDGHLGRRLMARTEGGKYLIDDRGVVVRKGIPIEQFEQEIRDLLASRAPRCLLDEAEIVVTGRVIRVDEAEGQGNVRPFGARILLVTIETEESFKGQAVPDTIVVVPPVLVVPYTLPEWERVIFTEAEEVLLFLAPRNDGTYEIVGKKDGKHRLGDATTSHVLAEIGWSLEDERPN